MKPYERLQRFWHETDSRVEMASSPQQAVTTPSKEDVASLEARYSVELPLVFRDYLLNCNLIDENFDDHMNSWWPLQRIRSLEEEIVAHQWPTQGAPSPQTHLIFADFMIWAWGWAIECGPGPNHGRIIAVSDRFLIVADSFEAFVDLCIANDPRMRGLQGLRIAEP